MRKQGEKSMKFKNEIIRQFAYGIIFSIVWLIFKVHYKSNIEFLVFLSGISIGHANTLIRISLDKDE